MGKQAENLKISLGAFVNAFRELSNNWTEYDSDVEVPSYPFEKSFDDLLNDVEEWIEEFATTIDDIEAQKTAIPVTYGMIKATCGWSRFCDVTGFNHYSINEWGDYKENEIFSIPKEQFERLF